MIENKKFLIISDQYPPYIGSASKLIHEFALNLKNRGLDVTVLTTSIERKSQEKNQKYQNEGIKILKIKTFFQKSNLFILRGIFSILSGFQLFYKILNKKYDFIFIYSPPLAFGITGILIKLLKSGKVIFNVQDLFPQHAIDLGVLKNQFAISFFYALEEHVYRKLDLITFHSQGNLDYSLQKYSHLKEKSVIMHNWINFDTSNSNNPRFREKYSLEEKTIFVFGGVVGPSTYEGLIYFINSFRKLEKKNYAFLIFGEGFMRKDLDEYIHNDSNIFSENFLNNDEYEGVLNNCNIGVVCLAPTVRTPVVPGKILGYMKMKKPIFAIANENNDSHEILFDSGSGCSSDYLEQNIDRNLNELLSKNLDELGNLGHAYAKENLEINKIVDELINEIAS